MRFDGTIKTWNDERGFGFIEASQGGQEIFIHAKAFKRSLDRPCAGQKISFQIELDAKGRKRACKAEPLRPARAAARIRPHGSAQWGTASFFAIPAFVTLYFVATLLWRVPGWIAGVYLCASVLAILVYAIDKSAASADQWRVSESTLLALGLAGGWPGAIIAQQVLRHKSSKASFRNAFWGTVALNVLGFVLLVSPVGSSSWLRHG